MRVFIKQIISFTLVYFNIVSINSTEIETIKMRELAAELRCMVCQNQSLLESDSDLAIDLKNLIKEMFLEGKKKSEIKEFLVERYGEFILFKPTVNLENLVLWLAPIFSLFIVSFVAYRRIKLSNKKS